MEKKMLKKCTIYGRILSMQEKAYRSEVFAYAKVKFAVASEVTS